MEGGPMMKRIVALILAYCLICVVTQAQERQINLRGSKVIISDLVLRDQEGRKVRFYSDLIKDKVVVLSFFYTSCLYSCGMQGKTLAKLQSLLGERLGKSVFLISVTTDPVRDSPEQLKAWATRYKAQPGWTFVTGEAAEMNKLLIPFTGNAAGVAMHLPATFIGNDKNGLWTSATGVFPPEELLKVVDYVTQDNTARSN
jgi:protein SCO1/2